MAVSRRSFIRIAGSSAVILAAGAAGIGGFAVTRAPEAARRPWQVAGQGYADPRVRALSYAILAPNPHNRQPWLVDLGQADTVLLYCDRTRLLPETDPFNRQILIGLGCFLELLAIAAAQDGYQATIVPFPDGVPGAQLDDRPVARIDFRRSDLVKPDPLFAQILNRRSNKEPYDTSRAVPAAELAAIAATTGPAVTVRTTADADMVRALRALTWQAHETEVMTPRTYMESVRLMRIGKAEIDASPDGIDIGGAFPDAMKLIGVLNRETIADPSSTAFEQGMAMYRDIMGSAMAYVWIATKGNSRAEQLAAGRAWVRLNLVATGRGVAVHPVSQALQEFDEMSALFDRLHALLAAEDGGRIQMLGRLGYAEKPEPSPRWPLATRVKTA